MNSILIREATFNDEFQVIDLWKRNNLINKKPKKNWKMIWNKNPAYKKGWPIGWVLESNKKIVGYLGNIPLNYYLAGKKINTAAARGFTVDFEARSYSLKLASFFFNQKNIDLFLCTAANNSAIRVYKLFHSKPLPCNNYKSILHLLINSKEVIRSKLIKHFKRNNTLINIITSILHPFFFLFLKFSKHGINKSYSEWDGNIKVNLIKNITDDFDELWSKRNQELSETLLADRQSSTLRWHYSNNKEFNNETIILSAYKNKKLQGYMIMVEEDLTKISQRRYIINDIFVYKNSIKIIDALIFKACALAKKNNLHSILLIGLPNKVRERYIAFNPIVRKLKYMPFWFYTKNSNLLINLNKTTSWYPGLYDGDSSL